MKTIKRTLIYALTVALLISAAAFTATSAFAADAKTYDVSEVVSVVGAHKEYEMKHGVKVAGERKLEYGDSVKFAYKERSVANNDGHYSRTAFGIGSYGFYFYHSAGNIDVRVCNMQSSAKNWDRAAKGFATIPDKTFKSFTEIVFKAELKPGDPTTVVLSLAYPGGTVTKEFVKDGSSDMLFRFGDHDVDENRIKSLAPKTDNEPPVITVAVSEFNVPVGAYPAEDAFSVTDNSGEYSVSLSWSEGALDELGRLNKGTHVCTVTATDSEDNSSIAKITYIVTEDVQPKKHKITFMAEGKIVAEATYTEESAEYFIPPEVPEKEHYNGEWEGFTPEMNETQVVNAKYTPVEYLVVFVADKKIVSEQRYSIENPEITEPKVPEKEGYTGVWEKYELNFKNARIVAVYTKTEPGDPDAPANPDAPGKTESGCGSGIGSASAIMLVVAAAFVLALTLKRKRG